MDNRKNLMLFFVLLLVAAISRLLPHPPNFTAVGAMALFGGAIVSNKYLKFALPMLALLLSDIVLNNTIYGTGSFSLFYPGMLWVYAAFVAITFLGTRIKRVSPFPVLFGALGSAVFFFVFTNFGYWMSGVTYPLTAEGLAACYIAAIPFFGSTLMSAVIYSALLFGGYYLVERTYLTEAKA